MLNLPLCDWSFQLFDLCALSSTDVPVLLLNQPINETCGDKGSVRGDGKEEIPITPGVSFGHAIRVPSSACELNREADWGRASSCSAVVPFRKKKGSAKISYICIDIPGLTMTGNSICFPVQGRLET